MTAALRNPEDILAHAEVSRSNGRAAAQPSMPLVCAADLADKPVPPRMFLCDSLIPMGTVTGLGGDGGVGKSLVAMQLAVATVTGLAWLGRPVRRGPVIFLSAEDDINEIHRRLAAIVASYQIELADLRDLHIAPLAGEDAVLAVETAKSSNAIAATPLWTQVQMLCDTRRPVLLILDPLADLFAGNENSRPQARQFVAMLRGLAMRADLAALLLYHPSLSGIASGTGTSGSTAWNNSVRSRLYLRRAVGDNGAESSPDVRIIETMKANYGPRGEQLTLRWRDGVFAPEVEPERQGQVAMTASIKADRAFLDLLAAYDADGRHVSSTPSANYAPAVFARDQRVKGIGKLALTAAMNRLFETKEIRTEVFGPPSRPLKRIVLTGETGE